LVVLVREDPAVGVVAASLLVQSGSAFETSDTAGVTNFLQRAMLRGTRRHSALALAEAAEELGGAVDASGDVDYAEVRATALARHWDALLALLAEVALEPTLPAGEIEKERALILGQLQTRADQPFPRAFDIAVAERLFKRVPGTADAATGPATEAAPRGERRLVEREARQAQVLVGFLAPPLTHPDYAAMRVLGAVLGGGMSSRLFVELRDRRGLAYSTGVLTTNRTGPSLFLPYLGTAPANADAAVAGVLAEVDRLRRDRVDARELA